VEKYAGGFEEKIFVLIRSLIKQSRLCGTVAFLMFRTFLLQCLTILILEPTADKGIIHVGITS